ncbi:MAG: PepSY domain-containing protein [Ruminococcus sp.]|nr:PepSY domain-containing protein [Ruminococcus sp.]MCM1381299.1 PepSY domain-containing protein [Muribaculaceae bacterium]MCM1479306.1 PepSY domain-containing protein [Muribaculaceae bacterium]
MKKVLILTAYILFAAALSGCGSNAEVTETSTETTVTSTETTVTETETSAETAARSTETISDRRITRKEAMAAAVEHSGLYDTEINGWDSTFDCEGDLPVIEVRFDTLYTYSCVCKVNAADGSVIDFIRCDHCIIYPPEVIPPEKAETIALEHAGLAADEVTFAETERVFDANGVCSRDVYSVKFTCGGSEYEYYIHSLWGDIIKY